MLQLANMIPVPQRDQRYESQLQQSHYSNASQMASHAAQSYNTSAAVVSSYATAPQRTYGYNYQAQATTQTPSTPPSPPVDNDPNKPSLPSISSLLGVAEVKQAEQVPQGLEQQQISVTQSADYGNVAQAYSNVPVTQKISLPPTPPLVSDHIDGNQSPSTISTQSNVSQTYYLGSTVGTVDAQHRPSFSEPSMHKRLSIASQQSMSSYSTPQYTASSYVASPTAMGGSYYPDSHILPSSGGLYNQRPLPSNFPPPVSLPMTSGSLVGHQNPWQHHHYISASSQAAFPQSQDRYVCPTCNKAFSRPSSLRIHSHSHTGEKPFKCGHIGCGKAFSVRSNMKRHERGCHAANNSAVTASS